MPGLRDRTVGGAGIGLRRAGEQAELEEVAPVERQLLDALRTDDRAEIVRALIEQVGEAARIHDHGGRCRSRTERRLLGRALPDHDLEAR